MNEVLNLTNAPEEFACNYCGGSGEDHGDDGPRTCRYCDGSGVKEIKPVSATANQRSLQE